MSVSVHGRVGSLDSGCGRGVVFGERERSHRERRKGCEGRRRGIEKCAGLALICIFTPYTIVHLMICLLRMPCIHHMYTFLANPSCVA